MTWNPQAELESEEEEDMVEVTEDTLQVFPLIEEKEKPWFNMQTRPS